MKKVLFSTWIAPKRDGCGKIIEGTAVWTPEYSESGLFHTWGLESTEFETGGISDSIAIIQKLNGEIVTVPPCRVKFID